MIPHPPRPGAPRCGRRLATLRRFHWASLTVAALAVPLAVTAQEPPDSLAVPDTLQAPGAQPIADSLQSRADTVSADTIFYNLPAPSGEIPPGFVTGVWVFDRNAIMASGANTLAELVAELPGVFPLWGGDYGTPLAMSAFGLGAGGYRIFRDGFEVYPVDGGVADLQRIPLVGIARVRLDRSMGAMVVEMWSHRHGDGRPFSVVEAGTGDLDTNLFRGVFAEPTALGGSIAVGLERADTRGIGAAEGGHRTGSWARYQLHLRNRAGLAIDFRRTGSQTKVPEYAPALSRSDVVVRGSVEVVEGVVAEAYAGRSTLDAEDAGEDYALLGGSRTQRGVRLGLARGGAWGRGALRFFEGDLPSRSLDVDAGVAVPAWGGAAGGLRRATWEGTTTSSLQARAWLGPVAGLTAFGSWESGTFGARDGPLLDGTIDPGPPFLPRPADVPPGVLVADRDALRVGGAASLFGVDVAAAYLRLETDVQLPLAMELDAGSPLAPGATRSGVEAWGSVPTPMTGLRLEGSYQRWDAAGPYLPSETYRAYLRYHRVHLDSGNLELWWTLGVRGNEPMSVFVAGDGAADPGGLEVVPFYQNWFGRIQVRIVTVRLFLGLDNFTLRRNLRSFPDRPLPYQRSFFGLRWDMWN